MNWDEFHNDRAQAMIDGTLKPTLLSCEEVHKILEGKTLDQLPEEQQVKLFLHFDTCDECRQKYT